MPSSSRLWPAIWMPTRVSGFGAAAAARSHGVLAVTAQPVVSSDFIGESASCIFDVHASMALNDRFFKLLAWYDNEYGYALRCVELAQFMAAQDE